MLRTTPKTDSVVLSIFFFSFFVCTKKVFLPRWWSSKKKRRENCTSRLSFTPCLATNYATTYQPLVLTLRPLFVQMRNVHEIEVGKEGMVNSITCQSQDQVLPRKRTGRTKRIFSPSLVVVTHVKLTHSPLLFECRSASCDWLSPSPFSLLSSFFTLLLFAVNCSLKGVKGNEWMSEIMTVSLSCQTHIGNSFNLLLSGALECYRCVSMWILLLCFRSHGRRKGGRQETT